MESEGESPREQDSKAVIKSGERWTDSTLCVERPECQLTQPGALTGDKGLGSDVVPAHSWHSESAWFFCSFAAQLLGHSACRNKWLLGESPQLDLGRKEHDYWFNIHHLRMGEPVAHPGTRSQGFNAGSVYIVWLIPQDLRLIF